MAQLAMVYTLYILDDVHGTYMARNVRLQSLKKNKYLKEIQ